MLILEFPPPPYLLSLRNRRIFSSGISISVFLAQSVLDLSFLSFFLNFSRTPEDVRGVSLYVTLSTEAPSSPRAPSVRVVERIFLPRRSDSEPLGNSLCPSNLTTSSASSRNPLLFSTFSYCWGPPFARSAVGFYVGPPPLTLWNGDDFAAGFLLPMRRSNWGCVPRCFLSPASHYPARMAVLIGEPTRLFVWFLDSFSIPGLPFVLVTASFRLQS